MKSSFQTLILASSIFVFAACHKGKGDIVAETRTAESFNEIELQSAANIEVYKDTAIKIQVSDYENIVKYTIVKIDGSKLIVKTNPDNAHLTHSKALVKIWMPDPLIKISVKGSGNVDVMGSFNNLQNLEISGSGNITANVPFTPSELNTKISGSGNITATGSATSGTSTISGSGNINLNEMVFQSNTATISGSGNIYLSVVQTLNATISGSGNIEYTGNPTVIQSVSGSGNVVKR